MSSENTQTKKESELSWTSHPLKRKPLVSVAVTLFILLISFMVHASTESPIFTVLSLVIMFGSLGKFYLPTKFSLTTEGITVKYTTYTLPKKWSQYRSFYPDKNGVLLSPFVEPSRLENFRGLFLMYDNNKEEVDAFIKKHISTSAQESQD